MKKEELEDMSYGDELISSILVKVNKMMKVYANDAETYDSLWHIKEVGERLLSDTYFEKSSNIQDKLVTLLDDPNGFSIEYAKWKLAYASDYKRKQRDYKLFFGLILDNIEDWV